MSILENLLSAGGGAAITQLAGQFGISQDFGDRGVSSIYCHRILDHASALAVIDPCRSVTQVEGLDWDAIGLMPAINGNFSRRAGKPRGNDDVLLMTRNERSKWKIAQMPRSLRPDYSIVVAEHRDCRHRCARWNR